MDSDRNSPSDNGSLAPLPDGIALALAPAARLAAMGELTRAMLHSVGNGLFVVLAQLELLREDGGADAGELRRVEASGAELKRTLARLAALARGDGEERRTLDATARELAELLHALGRAAEPELRLDAVPVPAGADELQQIVLHLLLHATSGGRNAPLAVECRREDDAALLIARGAGEGVAAPDGGLGLAVAAALARRLGGSLETVPDGSVRLSLPAA
jgi:C4-dicarboxylate-specific signal transduction histidine kinase